MRAMQALHVAVARLKPEPPAPSLDEALADGALAGRAAEEWLCDCGALNLAERHWCRECETPAPARPQWPSVEAHTIAVDEGDGGDDAESFMSIDVDIPDAQLGARMREILVKKRSPSSSRFHIIGKAAKTRRASV